MKRILLVLCLLSSSIGFSQNKFTNSIHLDIFANQVDGDGRAGYDHFGLQGGLGTQYHFTNKPYRLGFEINFAQRGSRERRNPKKGIYNDYKFYTNYVDVPVLYIFPKWGIHFEIGPTFSYLINAYEAENDLEFSRPYGYNKLELGALFSANFKIIDQLYLKVRINNSITSIRNVSEASTGYFWQAGAFHRGAGINLTYYFTPPKLGDTGEVDIP